VDGLAPRHHRTAWPGKSTAAALVAKRSDRSVLIHGDAFFAFLDQGAIAPWLPESHAQNEVVTRAAAAAAGRFAATYTVVYDGVVGPWFLPIFATETGLGALQYVILLPSAETCVDRALTRAGHGFTDEPATRRMHDEFLRASVAERHVFRDPPDTPHAVSDEVFEARRKRSPRLPPVDLQPVEPGQGAACHVPGRRSADVHAGDGAGDDEALDLRGAFEDRVAGSRASTWRIAVR
jgi:hypothetical protein